MSKFDANDRHVSEATKLGYAVNVAQEGYTDPKTEVTIPDVYRVEGHGVSIMLRSDDRESWDQFLIPEVHEHRVNFMRHMDADDDFEMSENEIMESSHRAAVATGSMTQEESDKSLAEWRENTKKVRDAES